MNLSTHASTILRELSSAVVNPQCTVSPLGGEHYMASHEAFELASQQQAQVRHLIEREAMRLVRSGVGTLRVLSIGCGSGILDFPLLGHLSGYIKEFVAIDPNPDSISQCKRTYKALPDLPPCSFVSSRFESFETEDRYDLIYCSHVLYYTKDHRAFVESMLSLLRQHGALVIAHAPREEMNALAQVFRSRQQESDFYDEDLKRIIESLAPSPPISCRVAASIPRHLFSAASPQGELLLEFLIQTQWSPLPLPVKRHVESYIDECALHDSTQLVLPHPATIFALRNGPAEL